MRRPSRAFELPLLIRRASLICLASAAPIALGAPPRAATSSAEEARALAIPVAAVDTATAIEWLRSLPATAMGIALAIGAIFGVGRWRSRRLAQSYQQLQNTVEERTREIRQKTQELTEKNLELELVNWNLNNSIMHARQLAEEACAASTAKSEFLATMSHEIRTPLNGVIGMNTLMSHSGLNEEQKNWSRIIDHCARNLLRTIEDILDFSKIEAQSLILDESPFQLIDTIEGTIDYLAPRAFDKGIELLYHIDPRCSYEIVGDETRIQQIITNLLGNAVKFTHSGYVRVEATVKPDPEAEGRRNLLLRVEDTGIGIDQAGQSKIFDPFTQSDSSLSRKYEGTGLGLAISWQLVKLMEGDISVSSEEGVGSVFTVTLPLKEYCPERTLYSKGELPPSHVTLVAFPLYALDSLSQTLYGLDLLHTSCSRLEDLPLRPDTNDTQRHVLVDWDALKRTHTTREIETLLPALALSYRITLYAARQNEVPLTLARDGISTMAKPLKPRSLIHLLKNAASTATREAPERSWIETHRQTYSQRQALSILVAEDNQMNSEVVSRALASLGYKADVAFDGLETLRLAKRRRYDLVLMDLHMPHLDGLTVAERIHAELPPGERPVIAALTAAVSREDEQRCREAGMDYFLPKPLEFRELARVLEDIHDARNKETPA